MGVVTRRAASVLAKRGRARCACGAASRRHNGTGMDATQAQVTPITDAPQVEYAPRPSVLRRRSTYWPMWFIVASVIVIIGLRMTRTLVDRWEVVRLQRT